MEIRGTSEDKDLSKSRAHELASAYVHQYPDRAAVIYMEVHKPNGRGPDGKKRWAMRAETEAEYHGPSYNLPHVRSTLQRQGKIGLSPDIIKA